MIFFAYHFVSPHVFLEPILQIDFLISIFFSSAKKKYINIPPRKELQSYYSEKHK